MAAGVDVFMYATRAFDGRQKIVTGLALYFWTLFLRWVPVKVRIYSSNRKAQNKQNDNLE